MQVNSEELKSVKSIALHFPKTKKGQVGIGVTTKVVYDYLNKGVLDLVEVFIDGTRYFLIPLEDQVKEDWGLSEKMKKNKQM